jgi:hypothetical protein
MDNILEVASKVSTPLALGGVVVAILFGLFKQIIGGGFFPKLTQAFSGALLQNVVNKVFYLALVAIFLGFLAYIIPLFAGKAPGSDVQSVSFSLTSNMTFHDAAEMIASNDSHTVTFPECTNAELETKVKGDRLTARTSKELLENLQYHLVGAEQPLRYRVVHLTDRGIYEIQCSP